MSFVDGLGVGDVHDVALRDRRRLSEDGVLIVVATIAAATNGSSAGPTELIARGFGDDSGELLDELKEEADKVLEASCATRSSRSSSYRSICTMSSDNSSTTAPTAGR
jgi:Predicted hydrolase of the metallo-beta-lactamase superfamily